MRKISLSVIIVFIGIVIFAGCGRVISIPVNCGTNFSKCPQGKCMFDVSFSADSILAVESGNSAKTIFFAGRIFLIGENFSHIWIGEVEDNAIEFHPREVKSGNMLNPTFDWSRENLVIKWHTKDGNEHRIVINGEGKIVEEK